MHALARLSLVLVGAYYITTALVTLASVLLVLAFDMARSEALLLSGMVGFPVCAALILWGWSLVSLRWRLLAIAAAFLALFTIGMLLAQLSPPPGL